LRITPNLLEEHSACVPQRILFVEFLKGRKYVLTTTRNIQLAADFGLDINWLFEAFKLSGNFTNTDGETVWYKDGWLHREDGPAAIYKYSEEALAECKEDDELDTLPTEEWIQNGSYHRKDGPAITYMDGTVEYRFNGNREDGPAAIYKYQTKKKKEA